MESTDPPTPAPDATVAFEQELEEMILTAFGRGAAVEGTWTISGPVADAPDWHVTIEKVPPAERTFDPTLLDE
ncbi:hypothetical protein ACFQGT_17860 [Natrialbaceae archaeon GCM10025810]|uniref:hypothetical protein n=1 Tax=Halovalidus salilacus TaxID=3075124 RepID=UPI003617DECA